MLISFGWMKNMTCALVREPFLLQILFAKLRREGRIFGLRPSCEITSKSEMKSNGVLDDFSCTSGVLKTP